MINKFFAKFAWVFIVITLLFGTSSVFAKNVTNTIRDVAVDVTSLIDEILTFQMQKSGSESIQHWIDSELTQNAGLSLEWYVFALTQSGEYDFSSYEKALLTYLDNHKVASASSRQKYALILMAIGSNDDYIDSVLEDSIGKQGLMSFVYGLHLLNNGGTSRAYTIETLVAQLLSMQCVDGGWAIMGDVGDCDATAMTIQSLAPYYETNEEVQKAIDKALELLSTRQLEHGDYASYGVANLESTAQVVIALSSLGIDVNTDERFIKNGNTLFDAMNLYKIGDGSFSHTIDNEVSEIATVQALQAFISYDRMQEGIEGIYRFEWQEEKNANVKLTTKVYVVGCILFAACVISMLLLILKKRKKNNFIFVWLIAILASCFVLFTDFQSVDNYYNGESVTKNDIIGTVTLEIRCDTVLDKLDDSHTYIPKDGVILETTTFDLGEGQTVYDILTEAAQTYKIQLDVSGGIGMKYVSGINYLYEFDFGELSGWTYHVNGKEASVGCDQFVLKDGDVIKWLYTCELGKDLE